MKVLALTGMGIGALLVTLACAILLRYWFDKWADGGKND